MKAPRETSGIAPTNIDDSYIRESHRILGKGCPDGKKLRFEKMSRFPVFFLLKINNYLDQGYFHFGIYNGDISL
jgi:hypothetical protein